MGLMKLNIQKFASSGTLGTLSGSYKTTYTVTWSLLSQSTTNNASAIRLTATLYTGNNTTISSSYSTFKLDGTTVYSGAYSKSGSGNVFVKTKDITVKHNNDGSFPSRSVSFSTNDYIMGSQSGSGTISGVPKINRKATVSDATNMNDETNPTVYFSNPGKMSLVPYINIYISGNVVLRLERAKGSYASPYTWEITDSERQQIRNLCKNINSTNFTIGFDSYSGSTNTGYSSVQRTLTIINANPIFNDFEFADINEQTLALTGDNQSVISGYSNIEVTIPISSKAIAQKEATMSKYRFNSIDANYSDTNDVSITSNKVTNGDFTVYAIDSRGNSKPVTKNATNVINYTPLQKGNITVSRENGVSESVVLKFDGKIDLVDFGTIQNSVLSAKYKFSIAGKEDWSDEFELDVMVDENGNFSFNDLIKGDTEELGFDINNSYNIELSIVDELSTVIFATNLGSGIPHIAYAKNGVGIMGKYDESVGGLLQVGGQRIDNLATSINILSASPTQQTINGTDVQVILYKNEERSVGDKFSIQNGKVKIGAGVDLVRVDLKMGGQVGATSISGSVSGKLRKNEEAIMQGYTATNLSAYASASIDMPSIIIKVKEGDLIDFVCSASANFIINSSYSSRSYFTIETIL